MSDGGLEVVRGSGNVFRDFDVPDADLWQLKAILGAAIIKLLDKRGLSTREAEAVTGIAAADFSRIRRANLERFSLDRLVVILLRFGCRVGLQVSQAGRGTVSALAAMRRSASR